MISDLWGDDQPNAVTKCGGQEKKCAMIAQEVPYKMQNPEVRKIFKKTEFQSNIAALQNANPGSSPKQRVHIEGFLGVKAGA